eukprot:784030_1
MRLLKDDEGDEKCPKLKMKPQIQKPPLMWYYMSNHILINRERTNRQIFNLVRRAELDELAREHAAAMAEKREMFYSDAKSLFKKVQPCRRIAQNVACGSSIRHIHAILMKSEAESNNIIDRRLRYMGVWTGRGRKGELYLCQIFTG